MGAQVKRTLVALALFAGTLPAAAEPLVDRAVLALFAAPNRVQAAVVADVCTEFNPFEETVAARRRLRKKERRIYNVVLRRLGDAYGATNSTDGELEAVQQEFCEAADNR